MDFHPAYRRDVKINQASLDRANLRRLFAIVQAQLEKAVAIQIATYNPDLFDDFEAFKQEVVRAFIISYTINKKQAIP